MTLCVTLALPANEDDFDADALAQAVARMGALVAEATDVRLHVTDRFDEAVRRATRAATTGTAPYTQERDFGFAVAKTITQADGSIDVIVDAGLFSRGHEADEAGRTFEHEGLHIAIEQRGESLNDLRVHRQLPDDAAAGIFASIAGVSSEEYRVERVLWTTADQVRADSHLAHFGSIARRIQETIRAAATRYQHDLDVAVIGQTVSDAFLALATSTAYVAAEIDATGGHRDVNVDVDVYAQLLGPRWRAVVEELRRLPPGDVPTGGEHLEAQAYRVAARLEDWLEHIGFSWKSHADGRLYFGVLDAPAWLAA
jgi:hypothetical protein